MKSNTIKLTGLLAFILLAIASVGVYAEESKEDSNMNKDQVEGRVEEGKGKVKEVTGKVIGDKQMEMEGKVQKNVGKTQKGYGDIKQDIKEDK
ncbi:MAG: CsbD family protein [Methylobacter sp.]|nr:CsbD family protein [Methylobacter sp.]